MIASWGTELLDWLDTYTFPAEARHADPVVAAEAAALFLDALLAHGSTSAVVFPTVHAASTDALFAAAARRGMRLIAGKVLMDRHAPENLRDDVVGAEADCTRLIERWHGQGRLAYAVTPRFAATSTRDIAAAAGMHSGSPFYHFESKSALLYAVMSEGMTMAKQSQQQALDALPTTATPREQLHTLIRHHFEILLGPRSSFIPVMLYEWRSLTPAQRKGIARIKDSYEATWMPVLEALAQQGALVVALARIVGGEADAVAGGEQEGGGLTAAEQGGEAGLVGGVGGDRGERALAAGLGDGGVQATDEDVARELGGAVVGVAGGE